MFTVKQIASYLGMSDQWVYTNRKTTRMSRSSMLVMLNLARKSRLEWNSIVTMSGEDFFNQVKRVMEDIDYGDSEDGLKMARLRKELQGKSTALKYVDPEINPQLAADVRALENQILELKAA